MNFLQFLTESTSVVGIADDIKNYYEQAIEYLRNKLNIPTNTKVIIHFNYNHDFGEGHNGSTLPDLNQKNTIHVYLRKGLDKASLLRALSHEMVHVGQIANKRLNLEIVDGQLKSIKWEGKPQKQFNYNRNAEWELEAHSMENELLHDIISKYGNV